MEDRFQKKYGVKEDKTIEAFHKSRRMFCVFQNKLHLAKPNVTYSHAEWFEKEGWITKKDDSLMNSIVRGIIDKNGDVYFYTGYNFAINKKAEAIFFSYLEKLSRKLKLNSKSKVFGGMIKGRPGQVWKPKKEYGVIKKLTLKSKFSLAHPDSQLLDLVSHTDQKILAIWAIDCTKRVLHYFEKKFPKDHRPHLALKTLQTWIATGAFKMSVIRKASLDAHAAAREVGADTPARSAARAAGQAVATAHVPRHAYGPAIYAQQAIHRASSPTEAETNVIKERNWQFQRLLALIKKH